MHRIGRAVRFSSAACRPPGRRDHPSNRSGAVVAVRRASRWPPPASGRCSSTAAAAPRRAGSSRFPGRSLPAAIYACLIQLYREAAAATWSCWSPTGLILILTGARAPLVYAVAVIGLSLVSIRSAVFAARDRLLLVLAACAAAGAAAAGGELADVRLFKVVVNDTGNLSGRGLLWPSSRPPPPSPLVRLGRRRRQRDHLRRTAPIAQHSAHLGGAQRVSPHRGRGRPDRTRRC